MSDATHLHSQPAEVVVQPDGLEGLLRVPPSPQGVVVFAHGSGSGRLSPRNNHVAEALGEAGFATLLVDLLLPEEKGDRAKVFDIPLLATRLHTAAQWIRSQPTLRHLPLGYFGASTGAGAALMASAARDADIAAIVSRGGRPDLAGSDILPRVRAPTLLIVGSHDQQVLELNRIALRHMRAQAEISIVLGASHLFEEPGTLEQVVDLAIAWFGRHFEEAR